MGVVGLKIIQEVWVGNMVQVELVHVILVKSALWEEAHRPGKHQPTFSSGSARA